MMMMMTTMMIVDKTNVIGLTASRVGSRYIIPDYPRAAAIQIYIAMSMMMKIHHSGLPLAAIYIQPNVNVEVDEYKDALHNIHFIDDDGDSDEDDEELLAIGDIIEYWILLGADSCSEVNDAIVDRPSQLRIVLLCR